MRGVPVDCDCVSTLIPIWKVLIAVGTNSADAEDFSRSFIGDNVVAGFQVSKLPDVLGSEEVLPVGVLRIGAGKGLRELFECVIQGQVAQLVPADANVFTV